METIVTKQSKGSEPVRDFLRSSSTVEIIPEKANSTGRSADVSNKDLPAMTIQNNQGKDEDEYTFQRLGQRKHTFTVCSLILDLF